MKVLISDTKSMTSNSNSIKSVQRNVIDLILGINAYVVKIAQTAKDKS